MPCLENVKSSCLNFAPRTTNCRKVVDYTALALNELLGTSTVGVITGDRAISMCLFGVFFDGRNYGVFSQ
jgi:hypothetical protein